MANFPATCSGCILATKTCQTFQSFTLDSNCLIKEGWPEVSTTFRNLSTAAQYRNVRLIMLDSVEQELEAHYIREFRDRANEARAKVDRLGRIAEKAALEIELQVPPPEEVSESYRATLDHVLATYRMERASVTLRESKELYRMAVSREAPFVKEGSGFQDAIICLAAIDHLAVSGLKIGAFLTRDGIFNTEVLERLARPKGVSLRLFEDAKAAFDYLVDDTVKEKLAQNEEDRKRASTAIKNEISDIERFIGENLEMPQYFGGEEVLQVLSIKVVGVEGVRTPITKKEGEPSAISANVSIEIKMLAKPSIFSFLPPARNLKLGDPLELENVSPFLSVPQPRETTSKATVALEFRAVVEGGNYKSIEPISLQLK
jgi:PIN domain